MKILIIDDTETDRKIMERFLKKAGYSDISTAENGSLGVHKVKELNPDLVILDTMLPDMVGFDVCKKIRENCGNEKPVIIITTGSVDAVDALRAKQSGANDYCVKSSDCAPLLEAVKNLKQT